MRDSSRIFVACILFVVVLLTSVGVAGAQDTTEERLKALEDRIQAQDDEIRSLREQIEDQEEITESLDGVRFAQWEAEALARNLGRLNFAKTCEAIAHTDLTWDLPRLEMPWAIVAGDEGILGLNGSFGAPMLAEMQEAIPHDEVVA